MFREVLHEVYGYSTYSVYNDYWIARWGIGKLLGQRYFDIANLHPYQESGETFLTKTHGHPETPKEHGTDTSPVIYIVRDPRPTLCSYAHYRIEIEHAPGPINDVVRCLIRDSWWCGWQEHISYWTGRPNTQFTTIVKFADLIKNPNGVVCSALNAVGVKTGLVTNRHITPIEELHKRWPTFFRKGGKGWRNELTEDSIRLITDTYQDGMRKFGYL